MKPHPHSRRAEVRSDGDDGTGSFDRFHQLARRLFAVPKTELDEKLAAYEKQKRKRRA